jgi:ABC-type antimicrobial peptide transport system permease subunit
MTFVVRGRSSSARFLETVKQEIRAAAPGLPFSRATTMEELVSTQLEPRRLSLRMLLLFSGIGLFLAALGVYGLLSTSAQARRHEIGMRMALGGSPPDIFAMLLREGAKWILAGVLLGGLAALALFRLLQGFLYDISYYDPVTFVGVALVMACIGLLAIVVPARRAMKLTPLAVLRHE